MKRTGFIKSVLFVPIIFALLLGCAGKEVKTIEGDPEVLYQQGLTLFNKRDYPEALKKFEQVKSGFPDSPPYTVWAELKVGDCHFFRKEYVEAIAAYEEFKKIHPTHEEMPYVQFQIGMAYFNQMLTRDRDQTFTKKALSSFEYLVANYPPSLFTEKAKEKIEICKKRLADYEFYVGNYYYERGNFEAASRRFQDLLEKFPKMPGEDETLYLLGKSYLELDRWEKAEITFVKIVAEYPKSPRYKEARAILDKGLTEKRVSLRKTKTEESKKKGEIAETEADRVSLVKFDEEKRQSVAFDSPIPVTSKSIQPNPQPKVEIEIEVKPEEEKRIVALPTPPNPSGEKEKPKKGVSQDPGEAKLVDTSEPVDITSDRVETYSKENLIIFKGNVIARQKDIVIYADSIEAMVMEGGKGIEQVLAIGNVKIQQGLRVASCQRAVFHNLDRKMILTGDPKVSEGDNMVSGEEIIFDLTQNRVEVKGGAGGRGKAKIYPGGEVEKAK
jgi:outer membrane protein assembly factor BamD